MLMAGGATGALAALLTVYLPFGFLDLAPLLQAGVTIVAVVSGASLGGLLAKLLGDALARTGVLSGYPIGRERRGVE
jgi:energy-coupling factor transport system substrate-specific component